MIIDFHVHGKITRSFAFDKCGFLDTLKEAKSEGINSIAITEHLHSKDFLEGYNFLSENYTLKNEYFKVENLKIFYGFEVTTTQALDILIIGNPTLVLELRKKIIDKLNGEIFIDINTLFEIDGLDKFLIILAHPYRKHKKFPSLGSSVIQKIDAIEINASDLYKNNIGVMKRKVEGLAKKLQLPIICGSDTHYFIQIGSVKNEFKGNLFTIKQIKNKIKDGKYIFKISDNLNLRVKSAKIIKKLICNK